MKKPENDRNRDNYIRCHYCGKLYHKTECVLDKIKGYLKPCMCEKPFVVPDYESPLISEDNGIT